MLNNVSGVDYFYLPNMNNDRVCKGNYKSTIYNDSLKMNAGNVSLIEYKGDENNRLKHYSLKNKYIYFSENYFYSSHGLLDSVIQKGTEIDKKIKFIYQENKIYKLHYSRNQLSVFEYQLDNNKRIYKAISYDYSGNSISEEKFEYDDANRILKKSDNVKKEYTTYEYSKKSKAPIASSFYRKSKLVFNWTSNKRGKKKTVIYSDNRKEVFIEGNDCESEKWYYDKYGKLMMVIVQEKTSF